ncbi:MAG: membrane protein insertion efficiency factor YidD [Candidatus Dojkabacteria bacterium]
MKILQKINLLLAKPLIWLIAIYQKLFSFDHSFWAKPEVVRVCIYQPSCSAYTKQALAKYGLFKGSWLGAKRVLSCHPLGKGGYDPVP